MMQRILKGDTSDTITLALADGFNYAGCVVGFCYQGAVRTFRDCEAGQTVRFNFTADETAVMALGAFPVTVRLFTPDGGFFTVNNADVKIEVTDCVADVREGGVIVVEATSGLYGVDDLPERYTTKDIRAKINEIIQRLGGGVSALCLAACVACGSLFGVGITVQKSNLEDIYNDDKVVTGVTFDASGIATTEDMERVVAAYDRTNIAARISAKADASALENYLPLRGGYLTGNLYMAQGFYANGLTTAGNFEGREVGVMYAKSWFYNPQGGGYVDDPSLEVAVKGDIPAKTSDIVNDSGYISNGEDEWQTYYQFGDLAYMIGINSKILSPGDTVEKGEVFYLCRVDYSDWTFPYPFMVLRVKTGGPFSNLSDFVYGTTEGYAHAEFFASGNSRYPSLSDIPDITGLAPKSMISATDATFSNAVISVAFPTNMVSKISELNEFIHSYGGMGATTLGGLIAALLAGLAALKKSKVEKYALVSASANIQAADRSVTKVTLGATAVTVTFPDADAGKTRDFILRIDAASLATGGSLTITKPTDAVIYGDAFPSPATGKQYLVAITETAANEFYVRTLEITIPTEA